jgi:hypothetical protein
MAFNVCRDRTQLLPSLARDPYWTNMRQKRAKAYKKLMAMYELSFGFRQPYQVIGEVFLVDQTIERKEIDGGPQWMRECVPPL